MNNKIHELEESLFKHSKYKIDEICRELKLNKDALIKFEESYSQSSIDDYSSLGKNHHGFKYKSKNLQKNSEEQSSQEELEKQVTEEELQEVIERIVEELVSQTKIWTYDGNEIRKNPLQTNASSDSTVKEKEHQNSSLIKSDNNFSKLVTKEEIIQIPEQLRPMLTGTLMKVDLNQNSSYILLNNLLQSKKNRNPNKRKHYYDLFRQGLDLLDLDEITYLMLGQNKDAMGYWLPRIVDEIEGDGFFKIPKTKIIQVPLTLLQLTRLGYEEINQITFEIVDKYCHRVFELDDEKKYFVKTGTFSSKFDFRNCLVKGASEVQTLGEYLLFIHTQALSFSHFDLSGNNMPARYGASTTNQWVVREYIEDKENNLSIYHGLPLHTEYRAFVDFDTKEILGIHPYWEKEKMENHFKMTIIGATEMLEKLDSSDPKTIPNYQEEYVKAKQALIDAKHDLLTFISNYQELNERYKANAPLICEHLKKVIANCDMHGQWSVDIMQNGDDFYIIDMAGAGHSTYFKETVPPNLRKQEEESWLPDEILENLNDAERKLTYSLKNF